MRKEIIITGGRASGKTMTAHQLAEKYLDENPKSVLYFCSSDGTLEVTENAEFEDVTVKQIK